MNEQPKATQDVPKQRYELGTGVVAMQREADVVVVEEPLEIALCWTDAAGEEQRRVFTITMRTPGDDRELALGLLHSEGLLNSPDQVSDCRYSGKAGPGEHNVLDVYLTSGNVPDLASVQRNLVTQSSCGVCGKTSLQSVEMMAPPASDSDKAWLAPGVVAALADAMRARQVQFLKTGGLHAAGLFSTAGELLLLREDIGRHNALDKLVGADRYGVNDASSAGKRIVMLSGRISFELVQKAVMAALPVVAAVGAPSSLAISLAQRFDITLIGFAGEGGFSVYSGQQRLRRERVEGMT